MTTNPAAEEANVCESDFVNSAFEPLSHKEEKEEERGTAEGMESLRYPVAVRVARAEGLQHSILGFARRQWQARAEACIALTTRNGESVGGGWSEGARGCLWSLTTANSCGETEESKNE